MFGTDASYGNAHNAVSGHFPYKRSKDLVTWSFRGMAMTSTPSWVLDTLNNMRKDEGLPEITNPAYGYWAPVVRKVGDKYRMYYSIIIDNYIKTGNPCSSSEVVGSWSESACIGLRENDEIGRASCRERVLR